MPQHHPFHPRSPGRPDSLCRREPDSPSGYESAEVAEIIQKIKKYDSFLDDEYGENALEMRNKIDEIEDLVQKEENPSRIKALLNDIKNLSIGVAGSLIASGIVTLLSRV